MSLRYHDRSAAALSHLPPNAARAHPADEFICSAPAGAAVSIDGIDISVWQTSTPNLAGLSFVIVQATYGTARDDDIAAWQRKHTPPIPAIGYSGHAANVRRAGLPLGAYAFGTFEDPAAQARAFLDVASGADFLALDLEDNGNATMSADQARAFIRAVHAAGRKIGLYHSLSGFPSLGQDWNWIAAWDAIDPGPNATIHQYRGAPLDLDRFRGDASAFAAFLAAQRRSPVTRPSVSPSAEPVAWAGLITSLLLGAIQYAAGHGILTGDQAAALSPQVAVIANAAVTAIPFLLSLVTRQAVTPTAGGVAPSAPPTVGSTASPAIPSGGAPVLTVNATSPLAAGTTGTIGAGTRRFALDGTELDPIGPATLGLVSLDAIGGPIHGHFYRTATEPNVYVAASSVTLVSPGVPATPPPAEVTAPPVVADPWAGQPPLPADQQTAFRIAYAKELDAALARYLDVADIWLTSHGLSATRGGGLPARGAIPQAVQIALAASVNASILRVAGYFGPETPGVSA